MTRKAYQWIAGMLRSRDNTYGITCLQTDMLEAFARECLPSGSGFDAGTTIDIDRSTVDRLVLMTSFHHMDDHGFYIGWSEHEVIVTPSLQFGCTIRVTGRDKRGIKEYIGEEFANALLVDVGRDGVLR